MKKILFSLFCVVTGILLLTGFSAHAHGSDCIPEYVPRAKEPVRLPDWFLRVFVAKNPIYFVLVEKDKQRLRLLKYENELRVLAEYPCATGEKAGKKTLSGDSRTPEGIYFITKVYADDEVTIFGKRAYQLDYPNIFDRNSGRNGDGIYIHGTNRELKPMSTNGCVTLMNKDLDALVRFLTTDTTPVMIIPGIEALTQVESLNPDATRFDSIKDLLLSGGTETDRAEFKYLYRLTDGIQTVAVGEFTLYENGYASSQGYSRSYLALNREKDWITKERIYRNRPLQAGQPLILYPKDKQKVIEFIETWRKAWEAKDIQTYIGCYSNSFRHGHNGRMDLAAYRAYKERLNRKYKFIKVDISDLSVRWTNKGAKVSFRQVYRSDQYRATGRKTLNLIFEGQHWRIKRESWFSARRGTRARR